MLGTRQFKPLKQFGVFISLASVAATVAIAAPSVHAQSPALIQIDGSSTVFPITEAVSEEYQKAAAGKVNVTVGVSGTGGGFKKFCAGETDISNASRPIKSTEMELCKASGIRFVEIPVAKDALTVVVNKNNSWASSMTTAELQKLWSPDTSPAIKKWSDIRSGWPDQAISLYGPGTDSGTFDYFTEAINGESGKSRTDYTASEDDNILVQGVSRDQYSLGYFGYAYYVENQDRIKSLSIDAGKGQGPIAPTEANVNAQRYTPLSRPLFIYVSQKALAKPEVKAFIDYYLSNAPTLSSEVGYVPLTPEDYANAKANVSGQRFGTIFAAEPTEGLSIAEVLKKTPKE
jgi:phosphate transport system substrate-binding protein